MYLHHKNKSNDSNLGPIDYFLIFVLIVLLVLALMSQFGVQVGDLVSLVRQYLVNHL